MQHFCLVFRSPFFRWYHFLILCMGMTLRARQLYIVNGEKELLSIEENFNMDPSFTLAARPYTLHAFSCIFLFLI